MSDAGIPTPTAPPCSRLWVRDTAWFIGETARPMSLAMVGTGTVAGFLMKMGVAELTVMATTLTALYGAKAWEKTQQAKSDVEAKKAGV